jgi:hypothetical protein
MSSISSNLATMSNRRRSQRVLLRIPILVIAIGPDKQPISERAYTAVVNAHGGLIHLAMKVRLGQALIVRNPETSEEQSCRVVRSSEAQEGKYEVGLEFTTPNSNFWHVAFPPSDWAPHNPRITSDTF